MKNILIKFTPIFIICLIENRSPIFKQKRVGRNQKLFKLIQISERNSLIGFMIEVKLEHMNLIQGFCHY